MATGLPSDLKQVYKEVQQRGLPWDSSCPAWRICDKCNKTRLILPVHTSCYACRTGSTDRSRELVKEGDIRYSREDRETGKVKFFRYNEETAEKENKRRRKLWAWLKEHRKDIRRLTEWWNTLGPVKEPEQPKPEKRKRASPKKRKRAREEKPKRRKDSGIVLSDNDDLDFDAFGFSL